MTLDLQARHGAEPYVEIVDEARERAADLIVIRRRGKRGLLANLLVGEMVFKVLAHAPCSVLVVPRGMPMWTRRVLVGIDPHAPDATLLAQAAALAAECALAAARGVRGQPATPPSRPRRRPCRPRCSRRWPSAPAPTANCAPASRISSWWTPRASAVPT